MANSDGSLGLVGLELLPGLLDRGVLVGGVLELDQAQGQAVDEEHDVGTAVVLVLDDGELVDREEVVRPRALEVDDLRRRPPHGTAGVAVLHRHAVDQHPVEGAVAGFERRALRQGSACGRRRRARAAGSSGLSRASASRSRCSRMTCPKSSRSAAVGGAGRDVRPVRHTPADAAQPVKGGPARRRPRQGGSWGVHGCFLNALQSESFGILPLYAPIARPAQNDT